MLFAGHPEQLKPMESVVRACKSGYNGSCDDDVFQTWSKAGIVEDFLLRDLL